MTTARLKLLFLDATAVGDGGMQPPLGAMTELEVLALAGTRVGDDGLARLAASTRLSEFMLDGSRASLSGVVRLFTELQDRPLDEALQAVGRPQRDDEGRIVSLDFKGLRVGDDDLRHLAGLEQLEWLYLRDSQVGDAGLAHLEHLANLTLLDLTGTAVTDAGLAHLQKLAKLRTLHLTGTRVSESGVKELREAFSGRLRIYRVEPAEK